MTRHENCRGRNLCSFMANQCFKIADDALNVRGKINSDLTCNVKGVMLFLTSLIVAYWQHSKNFYNDTMYTHIHVTFGTYKVVLYNR